MFFLSNLASNRRIRHRSRPRIRFVRFVLSVFGAVEIFSSWIVAFYFHWSQTASLLQPLLFDWYPVSLLFSLTEYLLPFRNQYFSYLASYQLVHTEHFALLLIFGWDIELLDDWNSVNIRYKKHFSRTSVYQGLKKKKKSKILCFVLAKQAMLLKNS